MANIVVGLWTVLCVIVVLVVLAFLGLEASECHQQGGEFVREWSGWYVCVGGRE